MEDYRNNIRPILKWAGGKRQILPHLLKYMPNIYEDYYEPFIGGGALLFTLLPNKAIINDYNEELINVYIVIRENIEELIEDLKKHENTSEYYYQMRAKDRDSEVWEGMTPLERASRTIYLNKTCYNGLYRVNSRGQFNTPFGKYKKPCICPEKELLALNAYFKENDVRILFGDYKEALKTARNGDFAYLDPPYDPISETAFYTAYTASGFTRQNQIELCETCKELDSRGVRFMLSNSATDFIKDLYKSFSIRIIPARRAINSNGNGRGFVDEVVVRNYE